MSNNTMKPTDFADSLGTLNHTVAEAVVFFAQADENLLAGSQTARQCLAHLVFWHREYQAILRALAEGRAADLRTGTFAGLNAEAGREFVALPMSEMACQLESLQRELDAQLRALPDLRVEVPLKQASHPWVLADLVPRVAAHIREHTRKFRAAEKRRGEAAHSRKVAHETQDR
jgi:hypothetical protein